MLFPLFNQLLIPLLMAMFLAITTACIMVAEQAGIIW